MDGALTGDLSALNVAAQIIQTRLYDRFRARIMFPLADRRNWVAWTPEGEIMGLKHKELPVFCVQYHPEAAPGPHDADYLFGMFLDSIDGKK